MGIFDDNTPAPVASGKKKYKLFHQHNGLFVLRNNDTDKFFHRSLNKQTREANYTEVSIDYASQFKHFAIPKILGEILNDKSLKAKDVEHFMVVSNKGKLSIK